LTQNIIVYDELSLNLEPKVWAIYNNVCYTDAKTLWIRPEIENHGKRYPIGPKLNMWCYLDPGNKSIKFEQIPSWFDPIFPVKFSGAETNKYVVWLGPSNQSLKFELIPSWRDIISPCLVFYGRNQ
jgi:hypothetical protein